MPDEKPPSNTPLRQRVRARFAKQGDLRLLGHQDLARAMERLLRRAGVKLTRTEGFHPRARISFPLALAVGIAATDEVVEFEMCEDFPLDRLQSALAEQQPPGLHFASVELVPQGQRKANVESIELSLPLPAERLAAAAARVAEFLAAAHWPVQRPGRRAAIDVRGNVMQLKIDEGEVRMRLSVSREASARPREILSALGLEDLEHEGCCLTRTAVHLQSDPARSR